MTPRVQCGPIDHYPRRVSGLELPYNSINLQGLIAPVPSASRISRLNFLQKLGQRLVFSFEDRS